MVVTPVQPLADARGSLAPTCGSSVPAFFHSPLLARLVPVLLLRRIFTGALGDALVIRFPPETHEAHNRRARRPAPGRAGSHSRPAAAAPRRARAAQIGRAA